MRVHWHHVLDSIPVLCLCGSTRAHSCLEDVFLHQRQTPNWRSLPTGAGRKELRWLCHLLPIMSIWTHPSVAGFPLCCSWHLSWCHEAILCHPPLFPPQLSLLVVWHSYVSSSTPLWSIDFMPRFLCISVSLPSSVSLQLFLNFWPLLWSASRLFGGWLFLSLIFCTSEG